MKNFLIEELGKVLSHYRNLFGYEKLYIFPKIADTTIRPLVIIPPGKTLNYDHCKGIEWFNFYRGVLTKNNVKEHLSIKSFFEFFNLDMLIPIRLEGSCYGSLGITAKKIKPDELEIQIGILMVYYLASFWKNIELLRESNRLNRQTQALLSEMTTILEISRAIESGENLQKLLEFIMRKCMTVLQSEAASLMLMTDSGDELEFKVALGPKGKEIKPYRLSLGKGIAGWVAENRRPLLIPDAYADNRFDSSFDQRTGFKTESIMCVPLLYKGRILGVMQSLNRLDSQPFNESDLRTFTIFAAQAALAIENSRLLFNSIEKEKLERDIEVASEIQKLIIPQNLPPDSGLEMDGVYLPSQTVGGDFYTVYPINKDEVLICIADVSGKGIPAALLLSKLHATLLAYLNFTTDLEIIMKKLNLMITELSTSHYFVTVFLAVYNKMKSELRYINAGHNPPFLLNSADRIMKLTANGISIGLIPFEYQERSVTLSKGDLLLFYTDGVTEAQDDKEEFFGEAKLKIILRKVTDKPCSEILNEIISAVRNHCQNIAFSDDFTLLVMRKH